jgi:NosR/NirI family nitrous oxide reductase transcriptional regulator
MPKQHPPKSWSGSFFSIGLLISIILFDWGGAISGYIFNDFGRDFAIEAASKDHTSLRLLKKAVPGSDSFSEKEGEVPVYKAYKTDPTSGEQALIGYAFVTPDTLPEPNGFSGPIDTLVGIDLEGNIVGLEAIYYKESLRGTWGDFLNDAWFTGQFLGKSVKDGFRIDKDIDGISRATISVKAMSRGVRNSLRTVTEAYIK